MAPKRILTLADVTQPRMVSIAELRAKLLPVVMGWAWAEDALMDLWKLGAPDPQASVCPCQPPCKETECPHIRRVLLIGQFKKWIDEIEQRKSVVLVAR